MHPTLVVMYMDAQQADRERRARAHRIHTGRSRSRSWRGERS